VFWTEVFAAAICGGCLLLFLSSCVSHFLCLAYISFLIAAGNPPLPLVAPQGPDTSMEVAAPNATVAILAAIPAISARWITKWQQ